MVSMKTIEEVRKELFDFLELEKDKNILLVVDDDEDGMTSAFQMKKFLEDNKQKVIVFFNEKRSVAPKAASEEGEFKELVEAVGAELIIVCDLNEEIASQKLSLVDPIIKVLIIDHHPTPEKFLIKNELLVIKPGLFSDKVPANYPTTKVIFDLFKVSDLAALIGIVGDSSTKNWEEFSKEVMQKNDIDLEKITRLANVIKTIVSNYGDRKKELFEFIYTNGGFLSLIGSEYEELAKQFEELIESERKRFYKESKRADGVELMFFETQKGLPSKLSNVLSKENKEVLVIYSKADFIKGSVRRADFKVDAGALIKYAIANSDFARGGGHIPAGGFSCPAEYFPEFKIRAIEFMKKSIN